MNLQQIFDNTDFVHASGTKEELQVAEYLKMQCEKQGLQQDWKDSVSQWAKSKMLIYMQTGKN